MIVKRISLYIFQIAILSITVVLVFAYFTAIAAEAETTNSETVTYTGYLIDEHCFENKGDNPGKDTKECLLMDNCIKGGYGIAVPQTDGSYKFYYFNGNFFTDVKALDGTEGQKSAYDLINASSKKDHFLVDVTGKLEEGTKASIKLQGVSYSVIDVTNLSEATDEEVANLQETTNSSKSSNSTSQDATDMEDMKVSEEGKNESSNEIKYIGILAIVLVIVITFVLKKVKKTK